MTTAERKPFSNHPSLTQLRLAVISDYLEQKSISVDLCTEMLLQQLDGDPDHLIQARLVRPKFQRYLAHVPLVKHKGISFTIDYRVNCFWHYPRHLSALVKNFDFFHVCDHSYAQLVNVLPAERTGVLCHDTLTFRPLLEPDRYPGSIWYKSLQRIVLNGLQKAAVVFYTTHEVRRQIERFELIDPARLVQAPLGIAPEFSPVSMPMDPTDQQVLAQIDNQPFILMVGSSTQRKRLDVLLDVFAAVRAQHPDLKLVRVGRIEDDWKPSHREQINRLGIADDLIYLHGLQRSALAELYRSASLVLVTSDAEGFGLPVIEALACGAIVVASDITVLREVGGSAAVYCPVGDVQAWAETVTELLVNPTQAPAREARLAVAAQYTWAAHAKAIAQAYTNLASSGGQFKKP